MSHRPANTPCACGLPGWMPGIEHIPIQWAQPPWITQRAGRMEPLAIVDHIMQGYLSTMVAWASNGQSKVIVHFGIDRSGRTVQFQPVNAPGRHVSAINQAASSIVQRRGQDAGTTGANAYTIGIEHEGCSIDPRPAYTVPAGMIYSDSNPWPEAMVEASIRVKQWCFRNVPSLGQPSRNAIIGHYEVDARNRPDDPSPANNRGVWPVERMLRALTSTAPDPQTDQQGTQEQREVPVNSTTTTATSNAYIVEPGDGLTGIARRFSTTVAQLSALNGISNADRIEVGQVLRLTESAPMPRLPASSAAATSSSDASSSSTSSTETSGAADRGGPTYRDGYIRGIRDAVNCVNDIGGSSAPSTAQKIVAALTMLTQNPPSQ